MLKKKKLLFLVTEDWYFYSHRLSLACAARDAGFEIIVLTNVRNHGERIKNHGLKVISLNFKRGKKNPIAIISTIKNIINVYKDEKPYIVHHVSLKPVILGSIASYFSNVPYIVNALTGLGTIFVSESLFIILLKILIFEPVLGILLNRKNTYAILQNIDDKKRLLSLGIIRNERTYLIKGSGVNINHFTVKPEVDGKPVVLFASRMIKEKGVEIFVSAARQLIKESINARFILVGDIDTGNPYSIKRNDLLKWHEEGIVEWWGRKDDMREVFRIAHIVCLPSLYGEGLPKVLLEAAASGKPIIASDIPGCREIVRHDENGLLVKVKNKTELVEAIEKLLNDKSMREEMGKNGRRLVEEEFTIDIINKETLDLYNIIESLST